MRGCSPSRGDDINGVDLTSESEGGMAVIGIDLGGTKTAGLVLDGGGIVER